MKIQTQQNNVNFKSIHLHPVNVRNSENGLVKAIFSELKASNAEDRKAISTIRKTWKDDTIGMPIIFHDEFFGECSENYKFHAIELPGKEPLDKRLLGLAILDMKHSIENKVIKIEMIFVKPENKMQVKQRKIKNIGEVLLGSIFNFAQKIESDTVNFISINDSFYHKTFSYAQIKPKEKVFGKLINNPFSEFIIEKNLFKKYIAYCQDKFKFNFSEEH